MPSRSKWFWDLRLAHSACSEATLSEGMLLGPGGLVTGRFTAGRPGVVTAAGERTPPAPPEGCAPGPGRAVPAVPERGGPAGRAPDGGAPDGPGPGAGIPVGRVPAEAATPTLLPGRCVPVVEPAGGSPGAALSPPPWAEGPVTAPGAAAEGFTGGGGAAAVWGPGARKEIASRWRSR